MLDNGSYGIVTSKRGCHLLHLRDGFDHIRIFHDPSVNPIAVKVIPSDGPLLLLCVYSIFCSVVEMDYSSNAFSVTIKKSFYSFSDTICCGFRLSYQ